MRYYRAAAARLRPQAKAAAAKASAADPARRRTSVV